jgi:hypothetical protein
MPYYAISSPLSPDVHIMVMLQSDYRDLVKKIKNSGLHLTDEQIINIIIKSNRDAHVKLLNDLGIDQ